MTAGEQRRMRRLVLDSILRRGALTAIIEGTWPAGSWRRSRSGRRKTGAASKGRAPRGCT